MQETQTITANNNNQNKIFQRAARENPNNRMRLASRGLAILDNYYC